MESEPATVAAVDPNGASGHATSNPTNREADDGTSTSVIPEGQAAAPPAAPAFYPYPYDSMLESYKGKDARGHDIEKKGDQAGPVHLYNGRIQKIATTIASFAAARLNRHLSQIDFSSPLDARAKEIATVGMMYFDARIFPVYTEREAMQGTPIVMTENRNFWTMETDFVPFSPSFQMVLATP
jgi:hypothetical protein